jgi:hypothetical protein
MPFHTLNDNHDADDMLATMHSVDTLFDDELTVEDVANMIDELRDKFERRGVDL